MREGPHHGRTVLVEVAAAAVLETAGRRLAQRQRVRHSAKQAVREPAGLRWLLRALVRELGASGAAELSRQRQRVQVALDKAAAAQSVTASRPGTAADRHAAGMMRRAEPPRSL